MQTIEEQRKKKTGIAGIIVWGVLLGVVIGRAYFLRKHPVRDPDSNRPRLLPA